MDSLRPIDRVALIPFNSDIRCIPQLTDDHGAILQAIRTAEARGSTKLYDALLFAMKYLSGKEGRKAIVSFSDGDDTARTSSLKVVLNAAARYGYPIYTVGAGAGLRREQLKHILRQLAEINSGKMFFTEEPRELRVLFEQVAAELRSAYVLNYYTQVPFDGRWHDVQILLSNPGYSIHCRRGFYARSGGSTGIFIDSSDPSGKISALAAGNRASQIQEATARAAQQELLQSPLETLKIDSHALRAQLQPVPAKPKDDKTPEFKVETRLVEVPVLIESTSSKETPLLNEKDFRIYEDDSLRNIEFFVRAADDQELMRLRDEAVNKLNKTQNMGAAAPAETQGLRLGRFYLVLDDLMTDVGSFMRVKAASEKIIREYHRPTRPLSLHFASESAADIGWTQDIEAMLQRLKGKMPQSSRDLTTNDNVITVHEAYLIERGNREAIQLAELKYASSLSLTFRNSLGFVMGVEDATPEMITSGVQSMAHQLIMGNYSQAARALNGLNVVISAAAAEAGDFPKGVIFVSSGFTVGRGSLHADLAEALDSIIAAARRQRVRIYTVDAAGLAVREALGIGANGAFLVNNPQLQPIIERYAYEWQHAKESLLNQLAAETGGRFSRGTNDVATAAGSALRSMGQLYYLGYLSRQPPDGRYHRIRIAASLPGARIHARDGYFARPRDAAKNGPEAGGAEEPWDVLLARATEASRAGDASQLASALEKLVLKLPDQASLWYNLGVARLQLGIPSRAVEALQRAFVLSPENKTIGSTLARALVAAGFREAAADVTELMIQRHPHDVELIMQLGRVFEADGRTEQAYRVYRRALDYTLLPPLDLYVLLTRTASRLGRRVEADVFIRDYDARGGDPSAIESWRRRRTGSDP